MKEQDATRLKWVRGAAIAASAVLGCLPAAWFYIRLSATVPVREAMLWADGLASLAIGLSVALLSVHLCVRRPHPLRGQVTGQPAGFDVLHTMGQSPNEGSALEAGLQQCVEALEAQMGIIALWDCEAKRLTPVAHYGVRQTRAQEVQPLEPSPQLHERVLLHGQPLILTDPREVALLGDHAACSGMSACLCSPVRGLRETMGVLVVGYRQRREFTAAEVGLLRAVGQQMGMALANARLREHSHRAKKELAILQEVHQQLTATLDADVVCEAVVKGARRLTPADTSFLGLWTTAGELVLVCTSGCSESWSGTVDRPGTCWRMEEGLAVQGSETHVVTDVNAHPPVSDPGGFIAREGLKAWISAPFQAACPVPSVPAPSHVGQTVSVVRPEGFGEWGEVRGILFVANRRPTPFDSHQAQLLADLASRAAISIANACLFHTVERSKQEWEATVDAIEDLCLAVDPDYTIRRCNRAAAEAQGLTPQQVVGQKCYHVFHHQEEPVEDCPVARSLRTGERAFVESFDPQSGRMHHKWAYPLFDDHGQAWTVVEYSRDVTAFKQAQARLLQEEKFSALRQTISGAAHELNNPLAVIMGYAQLLQDAQDPQEVRQCLDSIHRQAQRAREVVRNLLTFAPIQPAESEEETIPYMRVHVNQLLEHVLALRGYTLLQKGVDVIVDLGSDLPWIRADSSRLQQAFLNIIASAEQALQEVDGPRQLVVESRLREEGDILISFTDNGPAIPPSAFSSLFIPFLSTAETGEEGSRLGLSASCGIVQAHDGKIWAQNNPGGGATFFVVLPFPSQDEAGIPAAEPLRPHDEGMSASCKIRRPRILVIDDEYSIIALLQRTLEPLGHEVDGMLEGSAALSLLEERIYDFVILDLKMPGPDGRQIYALISERCPTLRQRVIFSTGDTANAGTRCFLEERGVRYLTRPFDLEEVKHVVQEQIRELGLNQ